MKEMIPEIRIEDYNYNLPDERIAKYPLSRRDASKLLHYSDGIHVESKFSEIDSYIPEGSLMVFNNTKVVPARLHFQRETGGRDLRRPADKPFRVAFGGMV